MSKLIIENQSHLSDSEALTRVRAVIGEGRISNNGKHYRYATKFSDDVLVVTYSNKASDRFVLYDFPEEAEQ